MTGWEAQSTRSTSFRQDTSRRGMRAGCVLCGAIPYPLMLEYYAPEAMTIAHRKDFRPADLNTDTGLRQPRSAWLFLLPIVERVFLEYAR